MLINKKVIFIGIIGFSLLACKKSAAESNQQTDLMGFIIVGVLFFLLGLILGPFIAKAISRQQRKKRASGRDENNEITEDEASGNTESPLLPMQRIKLEEQIADLKNKNKALDNESSELRKELETMKSHYRQLAEKQNSAAATVPAGNENAVKVKFSKFADEKGVFPYTHLTSDDDGSCYYKLKISEKDRSGQFEPIISELNIQSYKNNKSMLLFPYCDIVNLVDNWNNIKILEPGILGQGDSEWLVERKCKIELV